MAKPKTSTPDSGSKSDYDSRGQIAITSGRQYRETLKSSMPKNWKMAIKLAAMFSLIAWAVLYVPAYADLIQGWRTVEINPGRSFELAVPPGYVLDWEGGPVRAVEMLRERDKVITFSSDEEVEIEYRIYQP